MLKNQHTYLIVIMINIHPSNRYKKCIIFVCPTVFSTVRGQYTKPVHKRLTDLNRIYFETWPKTFTDFLRKQKGPWKQFGFNNESLLCYIRESQKRRLMYSNI